MIRNRNPKTSFDRVGSAASEPGPTSEPAKLSRPHPPLKKNAGHPKYESSWYFPLHLITSDRNLSHIRPQHCSSAPAAASLFVRSFYTSNSCLQLRSQVLRPQFAFVAKQLPPTAPSGHGRDFSSNGPESCFDLFHVFPGL